MLLMCTEFDVRTCVTRVTVWLGEPTFNEGAFP
jgi:hypothetical protein